MSRRPVWFVTLIIPALALIFSQGFLFARDFSLVSGYAAEDFLSDVAGIREESRKTASRPVKSEAGGKLSAGADGESPWHEGVLRIKVKAGVRASLAVSSAPDGIKLFGAASLDSLNRRFEATGIRPVFPTDPRYVRRHRKWGLDRWFEIRVDRAPDLEAAIASYRVDPGVEIAEPIYRKELHWLPDDPRFGEQWHYRNTGQTGGTPGADISLEEAWEIERGDPSVIVQVVDTGIDLDHPDLFPNLWINPDPDPDKNDLHGWNFADQDDKIQDTHGHGSHVSGTVAAVTNNEIGVAGVAGGSGTGDGARIMVARVFGDSTNGGFAEAIVYGADNGAVISQNSWGYTSPGVYEQAVLDAIDYFIANAGDYPGSPMRGGIFVNSAGNSNSSADYYPGFYPPALSVAATNHNDVRAWYSNYGDWIDIAAPGGETTFNRSEGVLSTVVSGYEFYQGTSMAAPHVSGVAALVASSFPGETGEWVEAVLIGSADNIDALNPDYFGLLGSGRLNSHRALTLTLAMTPGSGFVAGGVRGGPFTPDSQTYTLRNVSGAELNWTAAVNETWVEVSSAGGTLAAGAETDIEISLTAAADALPAGVYTDVLTVADTTSGEEFQRGVRLSANPTLCEALDNCDLTWTTGGDGDWFGQVEVSYDGEDAAQSGPITHNEESWLETEAQGPGSLYFWWKVSSEPDYDWLEFYIDGVLQKEISGDVDWREEAYELGAGTHTLRWVYAKDESVSVGRDCGWVDQVRLDSLLVQPVDEFFARGDQGGPFPSRNYTLKNSGSAELNWTAAVDEPWVEVAPDGGTLAPGAEDDVVVSFTAAADLLTPGTYTDTLRINNSSSGEVFERALKLRVEVELCEALDNCDLVWTTGGDAEWFGQIEETHDGEDAAQSGEIADDEWSWLETEVEGPGMLSFWWKVSSESGWDWLVFLIDDDLEDLISGETDWEEKVYELGPGTQTLIWAYVKDSSISQGEDCGWVDQVVFQYNPLLVPDEGFTSAGESGGPFTPASKIYTLQNVGVAALDWSASVSENWLEVSPAGGSLEPAAVVEVEVGLTAQADSLPLGLYSDLIEFSNLSAGITVERPARLVVEAPLLHDNGPIVTHPGGGDGGADVSALQGDLGMSTLGFGHQFAAGNRIADEFTVTAPEGWYIRTLTFLSYQTGSDLDSTITGIYLQIWDGPPGDPGSSVVFGDLTTNRLDYSLWSGVYRALNDQLDNTVRPVMAAIAAVDVHLPSGTYWIDWMADGSLASGPWAVPITILGQTTTGNALQYTGSWDEAVDGGTGTPQGFPFLIRGEVVELPPTPPATPTPFGFKTPSPIPTATPTLTPVITPTPPDPPYLVLAGGDYTGDGTSEIAVFRPATGLWAVRDRTRAYFGGPGDLPVPGDYSGNGRTDIGIFRPAAGLWAIRGVTRVYFGSAGQIPVPADYSGDGYCDVAVFDPATGRWSVRDTLVDYFGRSGDLPVPGDYLDGGYSQIAVFRPAAGLWAVKDVTRAYFGREGDRPVPGIYHWYGGGKAVQYKTQIAVFRPSTGLWAVRGGERSYFGVPGDYPLVGRFAGFVLDDIAIFRPNTGLWAVAGVTRVYFGGPADLPATR